MDRKLYEIADDLLKVEAMLLDDETEFTEALLTTLEGLEYELEDKIVNIAKLIKNIEYETSMLQGRYGFISAELDNISKKIKSRENKNKRLKEYILNCMNAVEKQRVKKDEFNIYRSKTSVLKIMDTEKAKEKFSITEIKIDKKALKEALKKEENIDYATLEEKEFIVIK